MHQLRSDTYTKDMSLGDPGANACRFRLGRCVPTLTMHLHQYI